MSGCEGCMDEIKPVEVTGTVTARHVPRFVNTQPRTFVLTPGDTNGPWQIRARTHQQQRTIIVGMPVPGGVLAGYGWVADNQADSGRQKGALVRSDSVVAVVLEGNNELWAAADPASANAMYLVVWNEITSET